MPSIDRSMAISRHTLTALVTQTFYPKAHLLISPKWMCLKPIWPSNICICHTYSTRTADEVTKQYHKQGMRQFVYRLSPTERRDLLKELRTEHEAGSTVIPDPTPAQLRYGKMASLADETHQARICVLCVFFYHSSQYPQVCIEFKIFNFYRDARNDYWRTFHGSSSKASFRYCNWGKSSKRCQVTLLPTGMSPKELLIEKTCSRTTFDDLACNRIQQY